ncbi:hypothetical protein GGTG_12283 [Gaeumannomyces tritici R3-111a-1]|uniref:Uncharacterized protein n=1 Tax=Gaeumannomyces tritici (strain R3-111a-1) TaxID=644352 RepID=J3PFK8_GAET3|nr:hypothetical protein GGTG_12283 [Gaeumannomyces tritici R3-111a-1]EJT70110.1 hypothetical protein GGTG_12283 [Gaeumannomyces tritici R3-111a-1]
MLQPKPHLLLALRYPLVTLRPLQDHKACARTTPNPHEAGPCLDARRPSLTSRSLLSGRGSAAQREEGGGRQPTRRLCFLALRPDPLEAHRHSIRCAHLPFYFFTCATIPDHVSAAGLGDRLLKCGSPGRRAHPTLAASYGFADAAPFEDVVGVLLRAGAAGPAACCGTLAPPARSDTAGMIWHGKAVPPLSLSWSELGRGTAWNVFLDLTCLGNTDYQSDGRRSSMSASMIALSKRLAWLRR